MLILKPHLKQTLLIEMPVAEGVHFILYTALYMNFCLVILIAADQLHPASTPKDVHKAYCLHI